VDGATFEGDPSRAAISSLYVDAVVEAPRGAWPFGCAGEYEPDLVFLTAFVRASRDREAQQAFIREHVLEAVPA
jgi:glutaconate CoA-transferase, subunit A